MSFENPQPALNEEEKTLEEAVEEEVGRDDEAENEAAETPEEEIE